MNDEPMPAVDADPELWLSALADDELDLRQRSELCLWLEQHPVWWRACAITLLDHQVLRSAIGDARPVLAAINGSALACPAAREGKPARLASAASPAPRLSAWSAALSAALLTAVVLGGFFMWRADQQRRTFLTEVASREQALQRLAGELAREILSAPRPSLAGLYPDHPVLVEISDSPGRTVFLTDQPVSDVLLESFVAAGHDVDVQPYETRFQTEQMRELRKPVLAVEVRKTGFLDTSLRNLQ